jgi:hypothetical protein
VRKINIDPTTLPAVTPEELTAYKKAMPAIIHQTAARILKELDYNALFGKKAEETVLSGIKFTARTFESIMAVTTPSIIDQQLAW